MKNDALSFRTDIQGMRAIAVALVVTFHVFPAAMPGGYIGVDVFFVISGFLICGLILKDAERNGRFNVLSFYDRRIRRLLPAASAVLVVTAFCSYLMVPETRWIDTGREIIASTLYVENLHLHYQSIDYLTADKLPSPVQHFWSLSVEEQFYLLWPVIMLVTIFLSKRLKSNLRLNCAALLLAFFLLSLSYSVILTENAAEAYFLTSTRIWELAVGGLLTCLMPFIRLPYNLRLVFSIAGIIMIFGSGLLYSEQTDFPGYAALLPTLGISLLLIAGAQSANEGHGIVQKVLSLKPCTFVGDISYSLYLWHWPIVVFAAIMFGETLSLTAGVGVVGLSVLFATLSKVWIEDPIRKSCLIKTKLESYLLGFGLMTGTLIAGLLLILAGNRHSSFPEIDNATFATFYPGALAIDNTVSAPPDGRPTFVPTLDKARGDIATVYAHGCHTARSDVTPSPCFYEPRISEEGTTVIERLDGLSDQDRITIVIAGDSHTAHWLPALKEIAIKHGLAIVTYTKSSCAFIDALLYVGGAEYTECAEWRDLVTKQIEALKPALLVTSAISNHHVVGSGSPADNRKRLSEGFASLWERLGNQGIAVAAIRETPRFQSLVPDCVASNLSDPNFLQSPAK